MKKNGRKEEEVEGSTKQAEGHLVWQNKLRH
jgi:hypothetical protein